jgi:hypothetical protein
LTIYTTSVTLLDPLNKGKEIIAEVRQKVELGNQNKRKRKYKLKK